MRRLAASCFGLGWLPVAPGTWGSLPPVIIFALMYGFGAPNIAILVVMAALAVVGSVICVKCAPAAIAATGETDPGEVVADEFAGQSVTFLAVPLLFAEGLSSGQVWAAALVGFALFRFFDIVKPWPARRLENLPAGWGVLADDLMAGLYAGAGLLVFSQTGLLGRLGELLSFNGGSLNVPKATVLGALQGLTEFLPVSSSGHLVLLESLFELDAETPEMLLFDLAVHVGTVAAIFIVFRRSIAAFFRNLTSPTRCGGDFAEAYKRNASVRFLVLAIAATIVTGVCGLVLEKYSIYARGSLSVVAAMWIITGTLLLITDRRRKTRLGLRQFGLAAALVIGLAQAAAIMPGISRSGATISVF
jgi:phosphatidylglycerophosphatase A